MAEREPLLVVERITKSFSGNVVLDGVDLAFRPGQVHAIAGENGAGKSTLINILAGALRHDSGEIRVDGEVVELNSIRSAQHVGIAVVHQELSLSPNLTVADNLSLGREANVGGFLRRRAIQDRAVQLLGRVGVRFAPDTLVESLSVGQQQLVEIARALGESPRLLILDEPTAALTEGEASRLLEILVGLRAQGLAIVYVSHRMNEIEELADVVSVLRDGAVRGTLKGAEIASERIVPLMVGREIAGVLDRAAGGERPNGETVEVPALRVTNLTGGIVQSATFTVAAGEIVGMAGLVGAGRSEIARLIFGADPIASGSVEVDGALLAGHGPARAMARGVVLLPESRKEQGLFLEQSIADNIELSVLSRIARHGLLSRRSVLYSARAYVSRLRIKCASPWQQVSELSGGNQQKVLLARCLALQPRVLLLDEPTRGIDVGAKAEIYEVIKEISAAGVAIVLISSELPEVLGLSDRVLVMHEGRMTATLTGAEADEETVMRYASGVAAA